MKGRITKDGALEIMHGGTWKRQLCSYSSLHCGHWCPKFGEPFKNSKSETGLPYCDGLLGFTDFTDERVDHIADAGKMVEPEESCENCEEDVSNCPPRHANPCFLWTPKKESEV